ncbi:MliC family protein [Mycobacterium vicinigordonae]|uniref:MliC family protein n=1 Tax=Mycobacterium vicinigordonae TaxID=1719132 RepID=A0A7D6E9J0_9MYCO|nr:MliC family protein [Mycobacterium vicinigordonae]QLL09643.1 MliC family protein [Mycobacterium vicinigordonae]
MRLIAALLAILLVGACGAKPTHPAPSTPSAPNTSPASNSTSTASPSKAPATFDCAKPANTAQQLVCGDGQLTELDRRVQTAYQQALNRPGADQPALTTAQSAFATTRDACADAPDLRTCVIEAYQTRLVELTITDPATVSPPVVSYDCPADAGTLSARFYNDFDPKTAVLDWKGNRVILFLQQSASGARYGRQGSEYWEHQGEVSLNLGGTQFVCHTK